MIHIMPAAYRAQLTEDLRSNSPERVASALEALDQAWRRREFGPLPMPGPDCLDAFGDNVPDNVLSQYLSVLLNYPDFEPTPSSSELRHALIEAVIRYGHGEKIYDVALALRTDYFPENAVADGIGYLRDRGLNNPQETDAVLGLVHNLLDAETTRKATIDALRSSLMAGVLEEIVEVIKPRLDKAELARLTLDDEE